MLERVIPTGRPVKVIRIASERMRLSQEAVVRTGRKNGFLATSPKHMRQAPTRRLPKMFAVAAITGSTKPSELKHPLKETRAGIFKVG
jgi:hypothetical protein